MKAHLQEFIQQHSLPAGYIEQADKNFTPLVEHIAGHIKSDKPLLVGINGSQGSGKSTLAAYLETELVNEHKLKVLSISIDDFYYGKEKRKSLAEEHHPLLSTRGVPGTHDLDLALKTLKALISAKSVQVDQSTNSKEAILVSRFDKSKDDLHDIGAWTKVLCPMDVIILEGWCVGSEPEPENKLTLAINKLESEEDERGVWRRYVNENLKDYQALFGLIDVWAMLKAPSFDCVYNWRLEQEEKLAKSLQLDIDATSQTQSNSLMSAEQVARFIQFYERITKHTLETLPNKVDYLYRLDTERYIIKADIKSNGQGNKQ